MAIEQELKNTSSLQKEFQTLLEKDFKDRKLKENEIIKATVTEVSKNYVVCDLRAKQEAMIPIDCLLYTSPSPRDLSTSRMPSSA